MRVPVKILESVEQVNWSKLRWNPYQEDRTTQGNEDLKAGYLHLFDHYLPNLDDRIHLKGVEL